VQFTEERDALIRKLRAQGWSIRRIGRDPRAAARVHGILSPADRPPLYGPGAAELFGVELAELDAELAERAATVLVTGAEDDDELAAYRRNGNGPVFRRFVALAAEGDAAARKDLADRVERPGW
jgi:hypothetical protein